MYVYIDSARFPRDTNYPIDPNLHPQTLYLTSQYKCRDPSHVYLSMPVSTPYIQMRVYVPADTYIFIWIHKNVFKSMYIAQTCLEILSPEPQTLNQTLYTHVRT